RRGETMLFGTENICRALAEGSRANRRVIWPEELRGDLSRNAQEMVWHGMAAQVELVMGTLGGKLPADQPYFVKIRKRFEGAPRWLEEPFEEAQRALPHERDLSVIEVALFCLMEHLAFRETLTVEPYSVLQRFTREFARRPSAQRTAFRYDA